MDNDPKTPTYGVYIPQSALYKRNRPSEIKAKRKRERQNKKKGNK